MTELVLGLGCVAGAVFLCQWFAGKSQYSKSIYQAVYGSYMEFWMKRKRIRRLSESSRFQDAFGKHRLFYQIFSSNKGKDLQPYLVVILSSGLYYIRVIRQQGVITGGRGGVWTDTWCCDKRNPDKKKKDTFPNPVTELKKFAGKMEGKLNKREAPVFNLAVFPDQCTLNAKEGELDGTWVINRSQLLKTIGEIHNKAGKPLDEPEIDAIWQRIAGDSLELEERNRLS